MPDTQKYPHLPAELQRLGAAVMFRIESGKSNMIANLPDLNALLALANEAERLREMLQFLSTENKQLRGDRGIQQTRIAVLEASFAEAEARVKKLEDQIAKGSWR